MTGGRTLASDAPVEGVCMVRSDGGGRLTVILNVNGQARSVSIDARSSLLDVLREELQLTGTKKGRDHGQCGACTVHVGGQAVLSCLSLAAALRDPIVTIEGLSQDGELHPLQQAFIDCDAFQCGYCTSGQIMSGLACIQEGRAGSEPEIREYMSGNLCRCGAYTQIVAAIARAAAVSVQHPVRS